MAAGVEEDGQIRRLPASTARVTPPGGRRDQGAPPQQLGAARGGLQQRRTATSRRARVWIRGEERENWRLGFHEVAEDLYRRRMAVPPGRLLEDGGEERRSTARRRQRAKVEDNLHFLKTPCSFEIGRAHV